MSMRLPQDAVLIPALLRAAGVTALLLIGCGCPSSPPSRAQPQQTIPTRWITVEPADLDVAGQGPASLQQQDVKAIVVQVPTLSAVVAEAVHTVTVVSDDAELEVPICRTGPEYLRLLTDAVGIDVQRGRFLTDRDVAQAAAVIVLSENLADRLFAARDPVGATVEISGQAVTVVGIVGGGHEPLVPDVVHEAYVPRQQVLRAFLNPDLDLSRVDRIRIRVEGLHEVDDTRTIIRNLIERRHPQTPISVH